MTEKQGAIIKWIGIIAKLTLIYAFLTTNPDIFRKLIYAFAYTSILCTWQPWHTKSVNARNFRRSLKLMACQKNQRRQHWFHHRNRTLPWHLSHPLLINKRVTREFHFLSSICLREGWLDMLFLELLQIIHCSPNHLIKRETLHL